MKTKSEFCTGILIVLVIGCLSGCLAHAQSTNSLTAPTFFTSAQGYLTSFNTNYTFEGVTLEASTGYKQVTGANAASFIDAQYDFSNGFNVDASVQFSGIGSALNGFEGGVGYNIIRHFDTAVNVYVIGGYDNLRKDGVVEPGLTLKKKITDNTFLEIGASLPVFFTGGFNDKPTFRVGTGFTF